VNDAASLAWFVLLLVRPGVLLLVAPVFGGTFAPVHVKIGLTLLIAIALASSVPVPAPADGTLPVVLLAMREAAIGFALGLSIKAFVAAIELAGHLAGFQLGLSYSAIVDPLGGVRNNLIATLYVNLALVAFLLVNGHHAFLRALAASYERVPIGGGQLGASLLTTTIELLGLIFVLGTRLAAPLVLVLIVIEIAMGLLSRAAPMLNIMVVGAPLRLLAGLIVLGLTVPVVLRVASGAADTVLRLGVQGAEAFR